MFDLDLKEEVFFPSSALRTPEEEQGFAELDKLALQLSAVCDIAHEVAVIEERFTGTDFAALNKEVVLQGLIKVLPFHMQTQLNADEFVSIESIGEKFKAFKGKVGDTLLRIWEAIRKFFAKLANGYNRKSAAAKKRAAAFTSEATVQAIPPTPGMATLFNLKTLTAENLIDEVSEAVSSVVIVLAVDKAFASMIASMIAIVAKTDTHEYLVNKVNFDIAITMGNQDATEKDLPLRVSFDKTRETSAVLELKSFSNPQVTIQKDLTHLPKGPFTFQSRRLPKASANSLLERVSNGYESLAAYMENDNLDRKVREMVRVLDEDKNPNTVKEIRRFGSFFTNYYKAMGDYAGQALDTAYYISGYMNPAKDIQGVDDEVEPVKALPHKK